jgi:uncharacterized repeat protein (TIGR01451 family)
VTITFTATPQLGARLNPPVQTNVAKADSRDASGSDRNKSGPYTAQDDAKATLKFPKNDLEIDKTAPAVVQSQATFTYTMKVTNNGPDPATGVVINDPMPSGLLFVSSADCSSAMVCNIGSLAVGASKTVNVQVKATYAVAGTTVTNTAVVSGNEFETNLNNNTDTVQTQVLGEPDVKITKTAMPSNPRPGDIVTYRLKAENVGTAIAQNVVVTDTLPVGVSFVSADSPCVNNSGNISCAIGSLTPGDVVWLEVKVKVDPWGTPNTAANHQIDVQKVEAQIDLNPGEQKTVQVTCPSGYFATDGSVRIDHVDQGTGDWTAPQVLESRASSLDTWQGTVKNTATGRAQAKIFAVCVSKQTDDVGGHRHDLIISDPISVTHTALAGLDQATLQCGPGQLAIQPGFISSVPADLLYSEPEGNGWKFKLDMKAPGTATYSIRCLTRQVSVVNDHTHDLKFEHLIKEFTIQPGQVNEIQLTCADGYKGIVADQDLDYGLVSLGNDPRPVTRAFRIYNPTNSPLKARVSLLCLATTTGGEHLPPKVLVNTAFITTTTPETVTTNNSSSATVTAEDTDNFQPVPNPDPVKPTPNNPIATTIVGRGVTYAGRSVTATLRCSGACSGSVRLVSGTTVFVGARKVTRGTTLASGSYSMGGAGKRSVKLKVNATGRKVLKRGSRALLRLSSGKSWSVRIR